MSPSSTAELDLVLPVVPDSVLRARRAVEDLARAAGAAQPTIDAVRLAVSEACTNVVVHAYRDRRPGRMHVRAAVAERCVDVSVADDGVGMQPRTDSPGLGLGLPLIAAVADELTIDGEDGVNRLSMRFLL